MKRKVAFLLYQLAKYLPDRNATNPVISGQWFRGLFAKRFVIHLGSNVKIYQGVGLPFEIKIGSNTQIHQKSNFDVDIEIGNNVNIGHQCLFITNRRQYIGHNSPEKIVVEDDVWIGSRVIVLGGVRIGKKAVVGAGCVVSKNVPPYSLAVGNPVQIINDKYK